MMIKANIALFSKADTRLGMLAQDIVRVLANVSYLPWE